MKEEIVYMLGIVGVGFLVNYALRALPFLLFSGSSRELPGWVDCLGKVISPVIIAALIVYSYSGLTWRTPWPYLAGALAVGLQLWKRNPLASIVSATVLYMVLVSCCGCASRPPLEFDSEETPLCVSTQGYLCGDRLVTPQEAVEILRDYEVPRERTICIRLDPEVKDLRPARMLMSVLARAGYRRPVLVTEQHGVSLNRGLVAPPVPASAPKAPANAIRYKKANE